MVEFKQDEADGEFKMMEINPKFWGSLDLAIASGVDFPFLLYKMAIDGDVNSVFSYVKGVRFMWPFPDDILHVFNTRSDVTNFVSDLFNRYVKKNLDIHDLGPISAPILDGLSIVRSKLFGVS
jgi:predicted ATP-grasp superfamily ATP-dependent carboligase